MSYNHVPLSPLCSLKASDPAAGVFRVREEKKTSTFCVWTDDFLWTLYTLCPKKTDLGKPGTPPSPGLQGPRPGGSRWTVCCGRVHPAHTRPSLGNFCQPSPVPRPRAAYLGSAIVRDPLYTSPKRKSIFKTPNSLWSLHPTAPHFYSLPRRKASPCPSRLTAHCSAILDTQAISPPSPAQLCRPAEVQPGLQPTSTPPLLI